MGSAAVAAAAAFLFFVTLLRFSLADDPPTLSSPVPLSSFHKGTSVSEGRFVLQGRLDSHHFKRTHVRLFDWVYRWFCRWWRGMEVEIELPGTHSAVWAALDTHPPDNGHEQVVLKQLQVRGPRRLATAREVQMTQTVGAWRHAHLARYYGFFLESGYAWLVFEDAGSPMVEWMEVLHRDRMAIRDIMRQILEALSELHRHGIVHNDIKPENILLRYIHHNRSWWATLIDFGHATDPRDGPVSVRQISDGTPAYMSPEALRHSNGHVPTPSFDIWSLGCILVELVSGFHPFHTSSLFSTGSVRSILNKQLTMVGPDAAPTNLIRGTVYDDGDLNDLVKNLLAFNQTQRLTAEEALHHPWLTRNHVVSRTTDPSPSPSRNDEL